MRWQIGGSGAGWYSGLAIWLRVRRSGLKMSAQQEWAGIVTDGTIRRETVYQKLGGSCLEESGTPSAGPGSAGSSKPGRSVSSAQKVSLREEGGLDRRLTAGEPFV
jgi:hypothetical protein